MNLDDQIKADYLLNIEQSLRVILKVKDTAEIIAALEKNTLPYVKGYNNAVSDIIKSHANNEETKEKTI